MAIAVYGLLVIALFIIVGASHLSVGGAAVVCFLIVGGLIAAAAGGSEGSADPPVPPEACGHCVRPRVRRHVHSPSQWDYYHGDAPYWTAFKARRRNRDSYPAPSHHFHCGLPVGRSGWSCVLSVIFRDIRHEARDVEGIAVIVLAFLYFLALGLFLTFHF